MASHNELGRKGESAAALFLEKNGYTIRHRDWRSGKRDLDIVAEKDGELVIVEVKTRKDTEFGNPEDAVSPQKIRHIIESTDEYLKKFELDLPVRFDIISVTGTDSPFKIEHIENAFLPPIW